MTTKPKGHSSRCTCMRCDHARMDAVRELLSEACIYASIGIAYGALGFIMLHNSIISLGAR